MNFSDAIRLMRAVRKFTPDRHMVHNSSHRKTGSVFIVRSVRHR